MGRHSGIQAESPNPPESLDFLKTKITLALEKALARPEILPYMREQLIRNTISEFEKIPDLDVAWRMNHGEST